MLARPGCRPGGLPKPPAFGRPRPGVWPKWPARGRPKPNARPGSRPGKRGSRAVAPDGEPAGGDAVWAALRGYEACKKCAVSGGRMCKCLWTVGGAQGDTPVRDAAWPWRAAGGIPHECEATEGEEERRGCPGGARAYQGRVTGGGVVGGGRGRPESEAGVLDGGGEESVGFDDLGPLGTIPSTERSKERRRSSWRSSLETGRPATAASLDGGLG